jgi:chemotaxis protein methyltransferase CheR
MKPADLEYLCAMLYEDTGVVLDNSKAYLFESRLAILSRSEGVESIDELLDKLRTNHNGELRRRFVDCMLTKETSFFRDIQPFAALQRKILPELIEARRPDKRLVVWSAACATGQEIFSGAMLIREHFPDVLSWSLDLRASDVSDDALSRASTGAFSLLEMNRGLPVSFLMRYFHQQKLEWKVRDEVRKMIRFFPLNLVRQWPGMLQADLLLLRNVLIYFNADVRREVLARAAQQLRIGGYLMLGGAETMVDAGLPLKPVFIEKALFFRRTGGPQEGR